MNRSTLICHCGNNQTFEDCCLPFLSRAAIASNAEQLMRSRFTAFKLRKYQYILDTQALTNQPKNKADDFDSSIEWIGLYVLSHQLNHQSNPASEEVEFVAFFSDNTSDQVQQLHERSLFEQQQNQWLYVGGCQLAKIKIPRNNPCFCNSGKKYKKCHALIAV